VNLDLLLFFLSGPLGKPLYSSFTKLSIPTQTPLSVLSNLPDFFLLDSQASAGFPILFAWHSLALATKENRL
jgi:hypothetical protein